MLVMSRPAAVSAERWRLDEWLMVGGGAVAVIGMAEIGWKPFKPQPARRNPAASAVINIDEARKSRPRERK
jgi:hypothetical protein